MRIASSSLVPIAFANGRVGWTLRLVDERERYGVGEASPLPNYSIEDSAACERVLTSVHDRLAEADETDAITMVENILRPAAKSLTNVPSARFAIETALLDLLGKMRGLTITECLGGSAHRRVAVNGVIGNDGNIDGWEDEAKAILLRNIRVVKIKIGRSRHSFEAERDALFRLRDVLPRDVRIRLDANGSFGDDARENLARLSELAPELVEEPTRGEALARLGECAVPWAVDESLADPALVDRFLDDSHCAVVVLKPALLGGLLYARKIAIRARERNLGVVVTHLFDGDVAYAAACELALSIDGVMACGLDHHAALTKNSTTPGFVTSTGLPGLGLA